MLPWPAVNLRVLTLSLGLVVAALSRAAVAVPPLTPADRAGIEQALERAGLRLDAGTFDEAVARIDAALVREPDDPALLYTRGFAHYAGGAFFLRATNREGLRRSLESALACLERVRGEPWESEAAALQSGILGQLIGLRGGRAGMTLGPRSARLLEQAARKAPASPRVILFRGVARLNTPPLWGGDRKDAVKLVQQAVARFAVPPAASAGPRWGRAEALAWLGVTRKQTGDVAGARAAWEEALALEPDYARVKSVLLPSLGEKQKQP